MAKRILNEGVVYPENIKERMHPEIEDKLVKRTHSLGNNVILPENDEYLFEEKLIGERFKEVVNKCKKAYDITEMDDKLILSGMANLLAETMKLESKHRKALEKLAEKMIREEFNMSTDVVEIHAKIAPKITLEATKKNKKPMAVQLEFESHDDITNAKKEVYKRRFTNAMMHGAANKCNHMYHIHDDEISDLDPRLPNKYNKLMSASDYSYFVVPEMENTINSGVVKIQFPTKQDPKAIIYAQAMTLPILIHELVKGVMELISAHGLPKDKKLGEYVINKADFSAAEPWDIRLGPAMWNRYIKLVKPEDFHLKHQIYTDLLCQPTDEFNTNMREIMAHTKKGKKIIDEVAKNIKKELQEQEFNDSMNEISSVNNKPPVGHSYMSLFGES